MESGPGMLQNCFRVRLANANCTDHDNKVGSMHEAVSLKNVLLRTVDWNEDSGSFCW